MSGLRGSEGRFLQLVYASAATIDFDDEQLDSLLSIARTNNATADVTGVLLYRSGSFFQTLEGPGDAVSELFEKISRDPRHTNVLVLASNQTVERNFGEWRMGFLRDQPAIETLPGFVDFFAGRSFLDLPRRFATHPADS